MITTGQIEGSAAAHASARRRYVPTSGTTWLDRIGYGLFLLAAILSFSAMKLGVAGLPFRVLVLLSACGVLIVAHPDQFLQACVRFKRLLLVIVFAAVLSAIVTMAAGTPLPTLVTQLMETHFQAIVGILTAGMLAQRFGNRSVILAVLAGFASTSIVALPQSLGFEPAWELRALIGTLSNDPPLTREFYDLRYRAMGLSFSPVLFGTQACLILAIALFLLLSRPDGGRRFDPWVLVACVVIGILCLATGNRSPLLGMVVFLGTYLAITAPRASLVLIPALVAASLVAEPLLTAIQDSGVRAVRKDSSSENRGTLREFGIRLLVERPLGYGLDFDSTLHAEEFESRMRYDPAILSIRLWTLHNYYLMLLGKHGIFLLLALPFILPRTIAQAKVWWAFLPYVVHIYYHNDGPLQGDFIFFFIVPVAMLIAAEASQAAPPRVRSRRRLRRAPA